MSNSPAPALTDAQRAQYASDGFTIVADVFSPYECDEIIEHHERAAFELDLGRPEDGQMKYRPMMHLADDVPRRCRLRPALGGTRAADHRTRRPALLGAVGVQAARHRH